MSPSFQVILLVVFLAICVCGCVNTKCAPEGKWTPTEDIPEQAFHTISNIRPPTLTNIQQLRMKNVRPLMLNNLRPVARLHSPLYPSARTYHFKLKNIKLATLTNWRPPMLEYLRPPTPTNAVPPTWLKVQYRPLTNVRVRPPPFQLNVRYQTMSYAQPPTLTSL